MRKNFTGWLETEFANRNDSIFLTGDLGFSALEGTAALMGNRFINAGVAEQNMISVAAALASQGLRPICYSIAPFVVFRPAEQVRLDVCIHDLDVKIVGNGGGFGYGIMGATHHAIEDLAVLSSFPNMTCYIPVCDSDVEQVCNKMMKKVGPGYLRLGAGTYPPGHDLPAYQPIRKLQDGADITIVGLGPVLLDAWRAQASSGYSADIFCVSELPVLNLTSDLIASVNRTKRLLVVEEHVTRGGLGELLKSKLFEARVDAASIHHSAHGYPSKLYGSQNYHKVDNRLDVGAFVKSIRDLVSSDD